MVKTSFIGISYDKLQKDRYVRQLKEIIRWKQAGAKGTIKATPGFGKSITAVIAIKKMLKRDSTRHTLIVVHTTALKGQWEKHIKAFNLYNTDVVTIQSIFSIEKASYHLLIVDEIHLFASEQFKTVFTKIKYWYILGLTGTFDRLDGKQVLISKYCPVTGTIEIEEALDKGWIADFLEINVPIFLKQSESQKLSNISKQINMFIGKFGDFGLMQQCTKKEHAYKYARKYFPQNIEEMTNVVIGWAIKGQRYVKMRQDFLYNSTHKIDFVVKLKNLHLKTIVFSQSIKFIDSVKEEVKECLVYHSQVKSEKVLIKKTKIFKKDSTALLTFRDKTKGKILKNKEEFVVEYVVEAINNRANVLKDSLKNLREAKDAFMLTAKALDTGFDDDSIELGVSAARTSSPTSHIQRRARIIRNFTYKDGSKKLPIFINLYVPDTQDERWLTRAQSTYTDKIITLSTTETINLLENHARKLGRIQ